MAGSPATPYDDVVPGETAETDMSEAGEVDPRRPCLVLFTGLPGTGKSTLSEALATSAGVPAFAGDWLLGALDPAGDALADWRLPTYLAVARSLLRSLVTRQFLVGQSAIVDYLTTATEVRDWRGLCSGSGARLALVECVCSDVGLHRSRLEARVRGIPGWHEIDWAHVERKRAEFEPLEGERLVIDAEDPLAANIDRVREFVGW
jgi:predicted kinase